MIPVFKPTWTWIWNFDISNIILYALIFLFLRQSKPKFPHSFLSSNISQNTQLSFVMPSKQGGTQKPLKAPKKERKELDEDDLALKAKLKAEKQALADFAANAKKKWRACLQFAKKLRRPISSFLFLLIFITFIPNTHSFLFDSGKKRKMYCLIFSFAGDLLSIQNIFVQRKYSVYRKESTNGRYASETTLILCRIESYLWQRTRDSVENAYDSQSSNSINRCELSCTRSPSFLCQILEGGWSK